MTDPAANLAAADTLRLFDDADADPKAAASPDAIPSVLVPEEVGAKLAAGQPLTAAESALVARALAVLPALQLHTAKMEALYASAVSDMSAVAASLGDSLKLTSGVAGSPLPTSGINLNTLADTRAEFLKRVKAATDFGAMLGEVLRFGVKFLV